MIKRKFTGLLFYFFIFILMQNAFADSESDTERGDKYAPVRGTIQTCFACHGEAGGSVIPTNPILGGQEFYYIYVQLKDFKEGRRASAIMEPLVADIEKEDLKLIAEYFSEQEWVDNKHQSDDGLRNTARKVIDAGQCVACHLGAFNGNSRVPRLANQHAEYLNKTMLDFKNKVRKNSAAKGSLFATFDEEQIKAVADYLAGFKE